MAINVKLNGLEISKLLTLRVRIITLYPFYNDHYWWITIRLFFMYPSCCRS